MTISLENDPIVGIAAVFHIAYWLKVGLSSEQLKELERFFNKAEYGIIQ
ncbi:MAG: hypothetical protein ACFFD4_09330 [Candidatus Odinarchaeota archaeon]